MTHSFLQAPDTTFHLIIQSEQNGQRLDVVLSRHFAGHSRSFFQNLIAQGHIKINGLNSLKSSISLKTGDVLEVHFPPVRKIGQINTKNDTAPFKVIFEHDDFFIIEKDAGIAVHPASPYSKEPSLSDWLVASCTDLAHVGEQGRQGIVHRLDKDTSGLMIIPRTAQAHAQISAMFKNRLIKKTYLAIVEGVPAKTGTLDYMIARHPIYPNKMMAAYYIAGRESLTHYEVIKSSTTHAFVKAKPVTGRTHQIRVHFATAGHPLIGDVLYGTASELIKRHALHASELAFTFNGTDYHFASELPVDMRLAEQTLFNTL